MLYNRIEWKFYKKEEKIYFFWLILKKINGKDKLYSNLYCMLNIFILF